VKRLKQLNPAAALARLIEMVGGDQWRILAELQKLTNYSRHRYRDSVREAGDGLQQTIFDLK